MTLLCLKIEGKVDFDTVIFSDTGSEMPETYDYIKNVVIPLCKKHGIEFVTVGKKTLYDDYYKRNIIPYRMFRSCTDKYKIRPINKFCKQNYGKDYIMLIGIDYGEKKRIRFYNDVEFPLVDLEINRIGCKKIIKDFGIPIPIKSGCWFCPFQNIHEWRKLFKKHPELFDKAIDFEKNCKAYPDNFLSNNGILERLRDGFRNQKELTDFMGKFNTEKIEKCVYCHS